MEEFGTNDFRDIKNIYAIVSDPLFDPFEKKLNTFIGFVKNNDLPNILATNPCRFLRKVSSLALSNEPFVLNANKITHTIGFAHFILRGVDAGKDADFGFIDENGNKKPLIKRLKGKARNVVLTTSALPSNKLVFYLDSDLGVTKFSSLEADCKLSSPGYGIIDLGWEYSGGNDWNDYEIRVLHR